MTRGRTAVAFALLLLGASRAHALDPARTPDQYRRQRWDAESGFPGGGVHAIAQDRDGYLWIASHRGLVRFDGAEFRLETGRTRGTPDILGLVADHDGSLWLRPDRPELLRHRGGQVESVPFTTDPREVVISAMTMTRGGGLLLYAQVSGPLVRRGEGFERLPLDPYPPSIVLSMAETADATLYLGTREAGLFRARAGAVESLADGLPDPKVNCLLAVANDDVWVGTDRGVVRWNGATLTRDGVPERLRTAQALALMRDRDANVWIGTHDGLVRVNGQGVAHALDGSAVTALFEDREGDVWVGDGSGLERLHAPTFITFGRAQGLPETGGAVAVDRTDAAWLAPTDGGLYVLRNGRAERVPIPEHADDRVYAITVDDGGLWLGRQRGGVSHVRLEGGVPRVRTYGEAAGLPRSGVFVVQPTRDGSVWAGTLNGGLSRLRDGRFETFTTASGLPSNSVNAIAEGDDGTLWVGTAAGLAAWASGAWTTRRVRDGLPSDDVNALLFDTQGVLWIGTTDGLAFLRAGHLEATPASDALREPVTGLAESEGWLWMATARRVMRVRRASLLAGTTTAADVVTYGLADGLAGVEGVRRHRSVVADRSGRIWFATNRGLSVVNPRQALAADAPPVAQVRALVADDRPVPAGAETRVPPSPQRLRIAYAGVSLRAPDRVRFRHRLDGFDADWSEPVAATEAVYANLGPGPYRFRVQAAGADGLWSDEAARDLAIAPALWQTPWFRIAMVAAAAFSGWLVYAWRLRAATRRLNAAFDERLAERTRIAQGLHDTLLQGFISASMQLHVAVEQVDEGAPARSQLARVQHLMGQVIEEGRNTVHGLRDEREEDLAQALTRAGSDLSGASTATLRVIVEGTARALHPAVHDALYGIGREAIANAFRHASAANVELEMEYASRSVRLLVRDDGAGVDPEVLRAGRAGHYGLSGMREKAEAVGGRLRLWSAPGAGTEIEVAVRGSLAYAGPVRRLRWRWLGRIVRRRGADAGATPFGSGGER